MCIAINCCPVCDVINFEIILSLLIKLLFYITKTLRQNVNISRTKRAFNMTLKAFSSFLKSSQLSGIASNEEGRLKSYLRFGGPVSARSHHSSTPWFHRSKMRWFYMAYSVWGPETKDPELLLYIRFETQNWQSSKGIQNRKPLLCR